MKTELLLYNRRSDEKIEYEVEVTLLCSMRKLLMVKLYKKLASSKHARSENNTGNGIQMDKGSVNSRLINFDEKSEFDMGTMMSKYTVARAK